nr:hypothetical protein [Tanacetum cinerariifolium]
MNQGFILHEDLTYAMLHEMVMKKFNLEAIFPLNLSAKVSSIHDNFDITDDHKVRFFVECASVDELAHLGVTTDDEIMAIVRRGKQGGQTPSVGRVLAGQGMEVLTIPEPRCTHTADVDELQSQHEVGSGSGCDGGEDDEPREDEDADGDEDR